MDQIFYHSLDFFGFAFHVGIEGDDGHHGQYQTQKSDVQTHVVEYGAGSLDSQDKLTIHSIQNGNG